MRFNRTSDDGGGVDNGQRLWLDVGCGLDDVVRLVVCWEVDKVWRLFVGWGIGVFCGLFVGDVVCGLDVVWRLDVCWMKDD